jgi:hypothetical protein
MGINVGGILGGGFNIGGSFNSLSKKKPLPNQPDSELKALYAPTNAVTLQYPMDLDDSHYLMFNVTKKVTKLEREKNDPDWKPQTIQTIVLPVPTNLTDTRAVEYQNANLGIAGGLGAGQINGRQAIQDVAGAVKYFGGAAIGEALNLGKDALTELMVNPVDTATAAVGGVAAVKILNKMGIGAISGAAAAAKYGQGMLFAEGKAYNPRMAVLFDRVNFRNFQFQYRLIARNETESNAITSIVRAFQNYMMPSYFGKALSGFNYPLEFQMSFSKDLQKHLFTFKPAVLQNVTVQYNGDTGPAFFATSNAPLIVDLSLSFQETKIWTRDQVEGETAYFGQEATEAETSALEQALNVPKPAGFDVPVAPAQ